MDWQRTLNRLDRDIHAARSTPVSGADEPALEACRACPNSFIEHVFTDPRTKRPFRQADIHRQWHAHIDAHPRALILAPREHGKTDQLAVGRVLWALGRDPDVRVKLVCEDDGTARKRLVAIRAHIERNERLHQVFPNLRKHPDLEDWGRIQFTVARRSMDKEPSVEAAGVMSSAVGGRADLLVFDDVVDLRNSIAQPSLREVVKETFYNVWLNLLVQDGRALYVATPWHADDLTAELRKSSGWGVLEHPIDESFTPVWPEAWSTERLEQRSREIGSLAFARGFRLVPMADEDAMFRTIADCLRPDLSLDDVDARWPRFTGVDLGHSKRKSQGRGRYSRKEKPYTVIFTLAVDPDGRRWPVEIRRGHWSGPDTARQVLDVHAEHHPLVIMIESNAYQATVLDWIRLVSPDASIPLKPFVTGAQKADEQLGLPGLQAEFESGAWIIPTDGLDVEELESSWRAWVHEMRSYPVAPLSDTVMACWFAQAGAKGRGHRSEARMRAIREANLNQPSSIYGGLRRMDLW